MPFKFEPLSIVPPDEKQKQAFIDRANTTGAMHSLDFKLSGKAPSDWVRIFNYNWYQVYKDGAAQASERSIRINASPSDISQTYARAKNAVAEANVEYQRFIEHREAEEAARKRDEDETKRKAQAELKEALDKIEF